MNPFYEAVLEGRVPFQIDMTQKDDGVWVAKFAQFQGKTVEVEDTNQSEAQRKCTNEVIALIKSGEILPNG